MKLKLLIIGLALLVSALPSYAGGIMMMGGGVGGNTDWTNDASLQAYYIFETSPGLTQDSKATNHVDDNASLLAGTQDTTNYKQGVAGGAVNAAGTDHGFILLQTSMTAGFPCNGTGDGEITVAGWFRPTAIANNGTLFSIENATSAKMRLAEGSGDGTLTLFLDGTGTASHVATADLANNNWYFIAAVYDDANNNACIYIRAAESGSSEYNCTTANIGTLDDIGSGGWFGLGARTDSGVGGTVDGTLDAWTVFNGKAMSQAELDGVFTNGWTGGGW